MAVKFWIENTVPSPVLGSDTAQVTCRTPKGKGIMKLVHVLTALAPTCRMEEYEHFVRCNLLQKLALECLADGRSTC
jgi:hypothetical protein